MAQGRGDAILGGFMIKFAVSACVAALLIGSAAATPVQFKLTGVVYNSRDILGVFGLPGASLIGQQFTATYVFDPGLRTPTVNSATEFGSYTNWWTGGPSIGLGASLTINGHMVHVGGQYGSEMHLKESTDGSLLYLAQYDYDEETGVQTTMQTDISDDFAIGYGSPTMGPWSGDVIPLNSFTSWRLEDDSGAYEWVSMDARHVTVSAPATAPVPEPANWAMMVGGFGLIGGALRTRRRNLGFA